ncbi:protein kinase domain-containing protein, partial [Thermococcus sp.]
YDGAYAVALAPNGDIIVAGWTLSFGAGGRNVWVLRLDENGNVKWQKTYGGGSDDEANAVALAPNGDIIVAGYYGANWGGSGGDVWVLRLPPDGNLPGLSEDSNAEVTRPSADVETSSAAVKESDATPQDSHAYPNQAELTVKTQYGPATLEINSDPSGANVYIDGNYNGITPLNTNLTPGTYKIKLTKQDYKNYTTTVTINPGESKTISATLTPAFGYLSVDSTPQGAKVYIDDSYAGDTPLKDYKLSTGEHTVKVVRDGYEEFTKTVTVNPGEKASVTASLVAIITTTTTSSSQSSTTTITRTTTSTPTVSTTTTSSSSASPITTSPPTQTAQAVTSGIPKTYILVGLVLLGLLGVAVKMRGGPEKRPPARVEKLKPEKREEGKPAKTPPTAPISAVGREESLPPGFPSALLSRYEPLEFIGEGGFAKVFKVKRRKDGKIVALKVPNLDEKARKFFLKEVKAWRLLDHPNIVRLYNAYDDPLSHLEIEFVDGVTLNGEVIRDLGKYPKPVDEEKALSFIKGIAEGLKHAHSKQVYHRDLKPQNVLITSDLTPKITDWGLAKVGALSTTATTTKGLTLLYAAPEQLDDEEYGHTDNRTDIYQLGLIFYELLTGKLPYQGTSPAVVMAKVINPEIKPKPPGHFNKELSKYDGIFEKLLAKRKEDRYQSVEEFLKDLELLRKLEKEKVRLAEEIEKTKTTMSLTTDSKELRKLRCQLVEQLSRNALLLARLNDKAELINALEDLKAFSREHRNELEGAIGQFELMMRESVPISKSTLNELKVLLHKVQREVGK